MKNFSLILCLITSSFINAQNSCDQASAYLVNAYSHVKDAYDSNNISHLQYYANRSMESFKLSKENLVNCGCLKSLALANKGIDLLAKVEHVEIYEDGRFYVKRAKEIAKESIVELDKFTASSYKNEPLTSLELEQEQLRQQQVALKQKEEEIKRKLADQELKSAQLKREKLINDYKTALVSNIKSYNDALDICNCNHNQLSYNEGENEISSKSIEEIKTHYIANIREITATYLSTLSSCTSN
ncbi:hypothetical protein WJN01_13225 [Flavobacteriaceae bacterium SZ-1-7]|uniref:hypothetical protein n=1 Tax=Tamlana sedimenti TaxID=3134126 RepID=UPI003127B070